MSGLCAASQWGGAFWAPFRMGGGTHGQHGSLGGHCGIEDGGEHRIVTRTGSRRRIISFRCVSGWLPAGGACRRRWPGPGRRPATRPATARYPPAAAPGGPAVAGDILAPEWGLRQHLGTGVPSHMQNCATVASNTLYCRCAHRAMDSLVSQQPSRDTHKRRQGGVVDTGRRARRRTGKSTHRAVTGEDQGEAAGIVDVGGDVPLPLALRQPRHQRLQPHPPCVCMAAQTLARLAHRIVRGISISGDDVALPLALCQRHQRCQQSHSSCM